MEKTVAETIRELTKKNILNDKVRVIGQCLSAVGWVQNTVPQMKKGIIELPMTDTAGAGFAVGLSLTGKRPIFILRFQSFLWLNASPLINNAAKSKEIFGYPAPVFIRAIASEGSSSGPVHTNCYHSPFAHMPGLPITAPMTPNEYKIIFHHYMKHDDPMLVSEHRRSYNEKKEFSDKTTLHPKISIFAISAVRFEMDDLEAKLKERGIKCDIFHILWLKPFNLKKKYIESLKKSGLGIVIDSTYEICSIAEHISHKLMLKVNGSKIMPFGMEDRSPGCTPTKLNGTPNANKILKKILSLLRKGNRQCL